MIPVDQHVTGPRGSCFAACLASLLELPIEAVPHEAFLGQPWDRHRFDWAARLDDFLEPFGLYALHFAADPERAAFPGTLHIMTGISPRGRPHAVVGKGHEIVHDPHPDKSGLSTVDGFVVLVPTWEHQAREQDAIQAFLGRAERVISDIAAFRRSLSPRDLLLVQIGLHASHMEEAIVVGDDLRAEAHLRALAGLVQKLRGQSALPALVRGSL